MWTNFDLKDRKSDNKSTFNGTEKPNFNCSTNFELKTRKFDKKIDFSLTNLTFLQLNCVEFGG